MKRYKDIELFYNTHIFCCTNKRFKPSEDGGSEVIGENCCAGKGAEELHKYMKEKVASLNLNKVRINISGCLGRCKLGKVIVIYPEGIWYHYDDKNDIDLIIEKHLVNGEIVEHLKLENEPKLL